MSSPAAYSIYDLLRTLIEQARWPTETERDAARESVDSFERAAIFGDFAQALTCDHPEDERTRAGRCDLCGRQIEGPKYPQFKRGWN